MGPAAATADLPRLSVAFLPADDEEFVAAFDAGHMRVEDREQVDVLYRAPIDRGGCAGQPPMDAFT